MRLAVKAFRGESIEDALRKACSSWYGTHSTVIDCALVNGVAMPRFAAPAELPADWVAEANARAKGVWNRGSSV